MSHYAKLEFYFSNTPIFYKVLFKSFCCNYNFNNIIKIQKNLNFFVKVLSIYLQFQACREFRGLFFF